jgi:hypothetical protein
MKTIRHITTLFYYDGPQVFEASDPIGGHYVAVMIEPQTGQDRFLVAGVEPERLRQFRSGLLDLSLATRRAIDRSNAHLMDVIVPATEGSFRILLEAAKTPDLLGQNELARALERVDALFDKAADPEQAAEAVRANRGHLAGAYLRLLRFLIKHNTGLRYSWAEPTSSKPSNQSVSEAEAVPLVSLLSGVSNLGSEPVNLLGTLEEADVTRRTWRIATPEDKYSGEVKQGGPSLEGLKIGGAYKFSCIEEIEEIEGTGREQRALYLIEHRPA